MEQYCGRIFENIQYFNLSMAAFIPRAVPLYHPSSQKRNEEHFFTEKPLN